MDKNTFKLKKNIIYYSNIKSKRIIQNILVFKIYGMVVKIDIGLVIRLILNIITFQLDILKILVIIYTDLYLLYKYLMKLRIIKKKRFIIDIIALK